MHSATRAQILTEGLCRVLRRPSTLHTQAETGGHLSGFRCIRRLQRQRGLRSDSLTRPATAISHLRQCLWQGLTEYRKKLNQANLLVKTYTDHPLKRLPRAPL